MANIALRLIIFVWFIGFSYCGDEDGVLPPRAASTVGSAASRLSMIAPDECFNITRTRILRITQVSSFCRDLFDGPPQKKSIEQILTELSQAVDGGATELDLDNIRTHTLIIDGLVLDAINQLNTTRNPHDPRSLWVVARLVSVLLCDKHISTNHAWLNLVSSAGEGSETLLEHLIGNGGIATSAINMLVRNAVIPDIADQGTNIYALTQIFARGAERFPMMFLEQKKLESAQMKLRDRSFTGSAIEVSALQIFETAILTANFETEKEKLELRVGRQTLNITQLQERLRKLQQDHAAQLISSRAEDATRIAQLEGALGTTTTQLKEIRDANTALLQRASGAEAQLAQSQSENTRLGDQVTALRSQATGLRSILRGIPFCLRCCCCISIPDDEDDVRRPLLPLIAEIQQR